MLNDSESVALGRTDRVRLDAAVARRCLYTRSRYGFRETACAAYLLEQAGRTWVVIANETGEVADSTLLTVESVE